MNDNPFTKNRTEPEILHDTAEHLVELIRDGSFYANSDGICLVVDVLREMTKALGELPEMKR